MNIKELTKASINKSNRDFQISIPKSIKFQEARNILIIQANTENFARLMIYPIDTDNIILKELEFTSEGEELI